ncbi:methyltransferase-like protein 25 isoform X7 [Rhinatrema bivittatum]|uniref:methyltransferase-like protein 25 isoform X7 n=1 Tax=Rhinatrema bivittatum TaxID=194408 RepID=UPI00112ACE0F|nr:methyltransferase-like protein 25 isoform X7 [Rhinatrema bivittatum]
MAKHREPFSALPTADRPEVLGRLRSLSRFLARALRISGAHTVDFYTQDVWGQLVGGRDAAVSPDSVLAAFRGQGQRQASPAKTWDGDEFSSIFSEETQKLVNLETFLDAAKDLSLPNLGICTSLKQLIGVLRGLEPEKMAKEMKTNEFMNNKKSHEVLVMSQLVDCLANYCGIKQDSVLVGLHTCGDLAPTTLRLFAAKPEIKAMCSVGCCYHLLSEEFESTAEESAQESWGFPMCQYLREEAWCCGRNARMSACLALERVAISQGLPTESLFYRAVLQVIIQECYGVTKSDGHVGKIFSKSSCFLDYVRKSLKKLGLDESKLPDSCIMDYYEKYRLRMNELEAFNMLKVVLAPCIETLILLDRLCYLREQDTIAWSGVVQLFDPVKSPRCYAIIAVKKW